MNNTKQEKKIKLAKHAIAFSHKDKWVYGLGSQQTFFSDYSEWEVLVIVSAALTKKLYTQDTLIKELLSLYKNLNKDTIMKAIRFLEKNNFLMYSEEFNPNERYSRNNIFYRLAGGDPHNILKNLSTKTVAIIGCGGIGNYIAHMLGLSGVGKLILVDNDKIELSNLNRQFLFSEEDIGLYKIDVIERELKRRNSSISIEKYYLEINGENSFNQIKEKFDLIVLSADYPPEILYWTNSFCIKTMTPFINVGYYNDISMLGPFVIPSQTACIACMQEESDTDSGEILKDELDTIHQYFKTASFPTVNAVASSMALNDIFKFLGGYGEISSINKRIGIYPLNPKIEEHVFERKPNCSVCGHL